MDARVKPAHDELGGCALNLKGCALMDPTAIDELAKTFMRARRTSERLDALPARLAPQNFQDS